MRLARSLIATATLLSRACPDQNFPPRSLVARFFGVFHGGNARVVELRFFNNTPRQINLYGKVTIWGGNTTKHEYVESLPPYSSVVKYLNVTLDSRNVYAAMDPTIGFVWPGIGCGRTWLKVFP